MLGMYSSELCLWTGRVVVKSILAPRNLDHGPPYSTPRHSQHRGLTGPTVVLSPSLLGPGPNIREGLEASSVDGARVTTRT